jgi:hypothetical protein
VFLLDTDVISALRGTRSSEVVLGWAEQQRESDLYLSVVSIGELERGIAMQKRRNPAFAETLEHWAGVLISIYRERILPLDLASARRWGLVSAAVGNSNVDLMIAATALEHGLTVVTRNVRHFAPTGVPTLNPFE